MRDEPFSLIPLIDPLALGIPMLENYQYRWQQFAQRLMEDLLRHPGTSLPGVRALSGRYQVSHTTVE